MGRANNWKWDGLATENERAINWKWKGPTIENLKVQQWKWHNVRLITKYSPKQFDDIEAY
jgi:hypothetical protein